MTTASKFEGRFNRFARDAQNEICNQGALDVLYMDMQDACSHEPLKLCENSHDSSVAFLFWDGSMAVIDNPLQASYPAHLLVTNPDHKLYLERLYYTFGLKPSDI